MNNNNKEFVSLRDIFETLKNFNDLEPEILDNTPFMISVKSENGIVREYPVKQFALVAKGLWHPKFCIRNYIKNYSELEL